MRIYIFGLAGLASKLLPSDEIPWKSVFLEYGVFEAPIPALDDDTHFPENEREAWLEDSAASTKQAFGHTLFKVSRQIRREAQCALLQFNVVELIGNTKSTAIYKRWDSERLLALRDVSISSSTSGGIEQIGRLLKSRGDWATLTVRIQDGLNYALLSDSGFQEYAYENRKNEIEQFSEVYPIFRGVKDFFVYYACYFHFEVEHEKMVMGPNYVSENRGKLSPDVRDWEMPWSKLDPPNPMARREPAGL